jgi:hypothetical protein
MQGFFSQDAVENYVKKYFENMAWLKYIGTLGCLINHNVLLKTIRAYWNWSMLAVISSEYFYLLRTSLKKVKVKQ